MHTRQPLKYSGGPINSARSNNSAPVHFDKKPNNSARSNNSAPVHFGEKPNNSARSNNSAHVHFGKEPNNSTRSNNGTFWIFWKAEDFIQMRKNFYQKRKIWLKSGRRENWLKTGSLPAKTEKCTGLQIVDRQTGCQTLDRIGLSK